MSYKKNQEINPQVKVKNNFTGQIHDIPLKVYEGYTAPYLYNKKGEPKFTVLETAGQFMARIHNTPPPDKPKPPDPPPVRTATGSRKGK